jgi:hypothetical protein
MLTESRQIGAGQIFRDGDSKTKTVYATMHTPPLPLPSASIGTGVVPSDSGRLEVRVKYEMKESIG